MKKIYVGKLDDYCLQEYMAHLSCGRVEKASVAQSNSQMGYKTDNIKIRQTILKLTAPRGPSLTSVCTKYCAMLSSSNHRLFKRSSFTYISCMLVTLD